MGFIIEPIPEPQNVAALEPLLAHKNDADFVAKLLESLKLADDRAKNDGLAPALYQALPLEGMDGWPTTFEEYVHYLCVFSRWIPHQSDDPAWADPTDPDEHQEIYDYLCWFYWLIDQPLDSLDGGALRVRRRVLLDEEACAIIQGRLAGRGRLGRARFFLRFFVFFRVGGPGCFPQLAAVFVIRPGVFDVRYSPAANIFIVVAPISLVESRARPREVDFQALDLLCEQFIALPERIQGRQQRVPVVLHSHGQRFDLALLRSHVAQQFHLELFSDVLEVVALVGHRRDGAVQAGSFGFDRLEGRLRGGGLALLEAAARRVGREVELFESGFRARRVRPQYFLGRGFEHGLDAAAFN